MDVLSELIAAFDPEKPNFRPTELYNESWMVKLVLHQASTMSDSTFPLSFLPRSTWFSEAMLPTAFKQRFRGDPLSESRTNADGVIGHIRIGSQGKADLELEPGAMQFTVVEAKIGSLFSSGTSNARFFDQAARYVACMAEVLARSGTGPSSLRRLDFIVLAPQRSIDKGTYAREMDPESIRSKVKRRVEGYGGELDAWYSSYFEPTMESTHLHSVNWESALEWIGGHRPEAAAKLCEFYALCLDFN